jgi:hypothetical protein
MSCGVCKKYASSLCSGCRGPEYCSKECLVVDWKKKHKKACARLPKVMGQCKIRYADIDQGSQLIFNNSGFTVLSKKLSDIFPEFLKVTGETFIQLLAYSFKENVLPKIVIGTGILHASAILKQLGVADKFHVLKPKSTYVSKLATKNNCKPIWLYGPDKYNNYLGIEAYTKYPVKKSIQFWNALYQSNLSYVLADCNKEDDSNELNILFKTGSFDQDEIELTSVKDM